MGFSAVGLKGWVVPTYTVGAERAVDCFGGNTVIDGLRSGLRNCGEEALHVHCVGEGLCARARHREYEGISMSPLFGQ